CPTIKTLILLGGHEGSTEGGRAAGEIGWDAFHAGAGDSPPEIAIDPAEPFCITFTGGTTGFPKGVVASHGARSLIAATVVEPFELTPRDTAVLCSPMFHLAGLCSWFYPAMSAGTTVVMLPKWDPEIFLATAERERATQGFMVPTMINAVLNEPGFKPERLARLRLINYGGSPTPVALLERVFANLPRVRMLDHYGQSECGAIAYRPPERARDKPTSSGVPFEGLELAILGLDGAKLDGTSIGEVAVRGPTTAMGYYNDPEQTAAFFTPDGWVKTGDLGYRDDEGYLFLVDRSKDMIIAGGENIYPAEIENALFEHPAVKECAVFGIPDAHWGEVPAAHVVLAEGEAGKVTPEALADFVASRIARHKRPRLVKFVDVLPKTAVGKVQKNLIRKPYWEGRERSI
ncbi:MAG: class I adenylate-forming enzyme family protein, partial [Alphaproteobacteria bacterium]